MKPEQTNVLTIAQISDSHLFADKNAEHCGVNVYQNLKLVLADLAADTSLDAIVFTGDLTQDHTEQSYKNFADLVKQVNIQVPFYFIAGNHDENALLNKHLAGAPFKQDKTINSANWQLLLLNTKSTTPAGIIDNCELERISYIAEIAANNNQHIWCFMHHHPVVMGYFIDRHPLTNAEGFWQVVGKTQAIKGISCGHVHRGQKLCKNIGDIEIPVLTCPATSIQFDPKAETVAALPIGAGYRKLTFFDDGCFESTLHYLAFPPEFVEGCYDPVLDHQA